ncbi:ABC transporter [Arthrobacter gandavensis]|uniref:ABC transporter n=1 Tax=Arthrobacter gandavensis TaxID=169960 RepID=UPI0018907659|nr:ABC transporter [Arthrobacter gandavensis]MBF4992735.1 ABC transporter [Arthrobacter gandavensis]
MTSPLRPRRRFARSAAVLLTLLAASGCAETPAPEPNASDPTAEAGHGAVAGAAEVSEPPLQLLTVSEDGQVGMLDLINGGATALDPVQQPRDLSTDGRYGFITTDAGLEIVDSGSWSWDHADHFHFYRAEPRRVGQVPGNGPATVTGAELSTAGSTGVYFAGSGEAVLLDNQALSEGRITEKFRLDLAAGGAVVAPLGDGAVISDGGTLRFHEADGTASETAAPCADPAGAITTRAGVVLGCADGAVLATSDAGTVSFEQIPYPDGALTAAALPATAFDGRKGRPTVAAVAGEAGFWLLDTRQRSWQLIETEVPVVHVAAVDDASGSVVALGADGRVRVFLAGSGELVATTDPLVSGSAAAQARIAVDGQRAYLNNPPAGVVHELDYADGARVARTLQTSPVPDFFAEVGR